MDVLEPTPEFLASRLALLALRATIGESTPLDADRVRVASSVSPLTSDAAAQLLATKAKPLICDAEARDRTLIINWWPLSEADANEQQMFEMERRGDEERGGLMGYLEERYGAGDHLVMAFGRNESLIIPRSVVDRWWREYEIRDVSYFGDDVDNPLAEGRSEHVEARRRGAKGVLGFSSRVNYSAYSATITLYGDDNVSFSEEAEARLIEMTRMDRMLLQAIIADDSTADPPPPRSSWGAWVRKRVQAEKERLARTAEMLKQVFKGRRMPPDVAAFIEECDKHLSGS
jgi:hypothetical protein